MGIVFYALTTYVISPHTFDLLASSWTGMSEPAVREMVIAQHMMPMMTQVVEFIIWSAAGKPALINVMNAFRSFARARETPAHYSSL